VIDVDLQKHSTFKIARVEFEDRPGEFFFVHLLTGPDNENDYTYLCKLDPGKGELRATAKTRAGAERTDAWMRLQAAIDLAWGNPPAVRVVAHHCGKCARCGRMLTDPESIERGIGPVCVGLS